MTALQAQIAAALLLCVTHAGRAEAQSVPLGTFPIDSDIVAVRKLAQVAPLAAIPPTALFGGGLEAAPTHHCRFDRLGPGPRFGRELTLVLSRVAGSERADGYAAEAHFGGGVPAEESDSMPLWYDARGQLVATLTLPPPRPAEKAARSAPEQPGQREEFVVFRWLPQRSQLIGEWQRAVGADPASGTPWAALPPALLVGAQDPYASSLRATAYLLCQPAATAAPRSAGRLSASSGARSPDLPAPSAPRSASPAPPPAPARAPTPRRDPAAPARP